MAVSYRVLGMIVFGLLVSGCSVHPLPEDTTGLSTYHIVRQIRCETRQAVGTLAVGWLQNIQEDPQARELGAEFASGARPIADLQPSLFSGETRRLLGLFYGTGVAYGYQLEMTENNNLDVDINFLKDFTPPILNVGLKAGKTLQRKNGRTFTVTDTFGGLLKVPAHYCKDFVVQENVVYPIAGKIGVEPMIQDFINLTLFGNLGGKDPNGPPTMADALSFETTVSASATPKITFSPVNGLADASITGLASRTDVHSVTIGLAIDDKLQSEVPPLRSTLYARSLVTARGGRSEQLAAEAVNQSLTLGLFKPEIKITQ